MICLLVVLALSATARPALHTEASSSALLLSASAPSPVSAGEELTYSVVVQNVGEESGRGTTVSFRLPTGFSFVQGSAEIYNNGVRVSSQTPLIHGSLLTWLDLTVPPGGGQPLYGMHTFVQGKWEDTNYQLDSVKRLMGDGAFVKQLLHPIDADTSGPQQNWINFVNGCYDRGLVPVLRLEGHYNSNVFPERWEKPVASPTGDYSAVAAGFRRVVQGLPRRDGHLLYIEVWNEPNLNHEWSGAANPVEYARFLVAVSDAIRSIGDPRIRILNGGLSPGGNIGPVEFIRGMATVPRALHAFDVWATHTYPGNRPPEVNLRADPLLSLPDLSIDSYRIELAELARQGRTGLKVLLTETGYALGANDLYWLYSEIGEGNRADYMVRAFRDYWAHWPEVLGVCPYQLEDPSHEWAVWDWHGHAQYDAVLQLPKSGAPRAGQLIVRFRAKASPVAGAYTGQASVSTSNLGSLSVSDAAPVQVRGGVAPTPTSPPGTMPPPTLCRPLLRNGGFEQDGAWTLLDGPYPPAYVTSPVHDGRRAMRVGIVDGPRVHSYSSVQQTFRVPDDAASLRISFWHYSVATDLSWNRQYAILLDESGETVEWIFWGASASARWNYFEHELLGYAGRTLTLRFSVRNGQTGGTAGMYVDSVQAMACGIPADLGSPQVWLPIVSRAGRFPPSGRAAAALQSESTPPLEPGPLNEPTLDRPQGLAQLATLPPDEGSVHALAWDPPRRRVVAAAGTRLTVLDGIGGRTLFEADLGGEATALAVDERDGTIYAALPASGQVQVWSAAGALEATLPGLGRPVALALAPGRVYVADAEGSRVVALDDTTHTPLAERSMDLVPMALAVDPAAGRLYVAQASHPQIVSLDADTLDVAGETGLGSTGYPMALALDGASQRLYVTHRLSPKYGAISVIDTSTLAVLNTLWGNPSRPLWGAGAVAVDGPGERVLFRTGQELLTLDAASLAIRSEQDAPGSVPGPMALDEIDGVAYLVGAQGRLWSLGLGEIP